MITRKQYMDREATHEAYYGQFVSDAVIAYVVRCIGADAIRGSKDEHMNDVPLRRWDALAGIKDVIDTKLFKACNNVTYAPQYADKFLWSLSDQVCIAKAAARAWKERQPVTETA